VAANPIIQATGSSSGAGIPGVDKVNLIAGEVVTIVDSEASNSGQSYQWFLDDTPIDTSISLINAGTASPSFVVPADAATGSGTVLLRGVVNGVYLSTIRISLPQPNTGTRIPHFGEETESNANGNTKGWHKSQTEWMRAANARLAYLLSADPSAGGGLEAPIGSIGQRDNAGVGELWQKTGGGDTAWALVGGGGGGGVSNLQEAYDGGPTIITSASGPVAISRALDDGNNVLSLTKAPVSVANSGNALSLIMGANANDSALAIANSGSGAAIEWDAGQALGAGSTTAGAPAYSFVGATGYGMYYVSSETRMVAGGQSIISMSTSRVQVNKNLRLVDGTVTAPSSSYTSETNTGRYLSAAGQMSFTVQGSAAMHLVPGEIRVVGGSGDAVNLHLSSQGDANTGTFWGNSGDPDVLGFATAGAEAMRLDASQNMLVKANVGMGIGQRLILDDDDDTYIHASVDDTMDFHASSGRRMRLTGAILSMSVPMSPIPGTALAPGIRNNDDADSGFFFDTVGHAAVTTAGVEAMRWNENQQTIIPDGSAAVPSLAFSGSTLTGICKGVGHSLMLVASTTATLRILPSQTASNVNGSAATPAFTWNQSLTSGFYRLAADSIGVATAATAAMHWNASQQSVIPDGLATAPSLALSSNLGSGMYGDATYLKFAVGGAEQMRMSTTVMRISNTLELQERAAATASNAGYGQVWAKNDQTLWFIDGLGVSTQLGVGGTHPDPHQLGSGTSGAPTYSFSAQTTSGMYLVAAGTVGFVVNGTSSMFLRGGVIRTASASGSASVLQLASQGDVDTGVFWGNAGAPDTLGFATGGTQALLLDASLDATFSGDVVLGTGQGLVLDDDGDTMFKASADDNVQFIIAGGARHIYNAATHTHYSTNVGEGESVGYNLVNSSGAIGGGTQQYSAMIRLAGMGYDSVAVGSKYVAFAMQTRTEEQAGPPTGDLVFKSSIDGAAYDDRLVIQSGGDLVVNPVSATARIRMGTNSSTNYITMSSSNYMALSMGSGQWHKFGAGYYEINTAGSSAAAPAIRLSDTNSGVFRPAASEVGISTAGLEAMRWNASQQTLVPDGLVGAPSYSYASDVTSGTYLDAGGLSLAYLGVKILNLGSSNTDVTTTFRPSTDNTKNLGGATRQWSTVFGRQLRGRYDNIGTAETHSVELLNLQDAADGVVQYSPMLVFEGQTRLTGVESQEAKMAFQLETVEDAATPTSELVLKSSLDGGAYEDVLKVYSDGDINIGPNNSNPRIYFGPVASGDYIHHGAGDVLYIYSASSQRHRLGIGFHDINITSGFGDNAAVPALRLNDNNSGLFRPANSEIAVSTALLEACRWDGSQHMYNAANTYGGLGQATYFDASDTYITAPLDDQLEFWTGGTRRMYLKNTILSVYVPLSVITGTESVPGIRNNSDADTGVFFPGGSVMAVTASGTERQRWTSNGTGVPVSSIYRNDVRDASPSVDHNVAGLELANSTDADVTYGEQDSPALLWQGSVYGDALRTFNWSMQAKAGSQSEASFDSSFEIATQDSTGWSTMLTFKSPYGTSSGAHFNCDVRPSTDSSRLLGHASYRWQRLYVDAITCGGAVTCSSLTASLDIDALGGFRRTLPLVYLTSPAASNTYTMRFDGSTTVGDDSYGWFVMPRDGSIVEISVWAETALGTGQVSFWVQTSDDEGSSWSDAWGSSGSPATVLNTTAPTDRVNYASQAKDTDAASKGDLVRIRALFNGSYSGSRKVFATLGVEC